MPASGVGFGDEQPDARRIAPLAFGLELSGDGDELKLLQKDNVAKICLTGLIYGRARHPDCRNMLDDEAAKDLPELLPTWTDAAWGH